MISRKQERYEERDLVIVQMVKNGTLFPTIVEVISYDEYSDMYIVSDGEDSNMRFLSGSIVGKVSERPTIEMCEPEQSIQELEALNMEESIDSIHNSMAPIDVKRKTINEYYDIDEEFVSDKRLIFDSKDGINLNVVMGNGLIVDIKTITGELDNMTVIEHDDAAYIKIRKK